MYPSSSARESEHRALLACWDRVLENGDAGECAAESRTVVTGRKEEFWGRGSVDAFRFCWKAGWVEGWDTNGGYAE